MNPRNAVKRSIERMPVGLKAGIRRRYYRRQARRPGFGPEEPEMALVNELLHPGDWMLDVGAYVGHYTIPASRRVGKAGRVIAVEPLPENFEILTSNVVAAGCRNVTLLNIAASREDRVVRMSTPSWQDGLPAPSRTQVGLNAGGTEVLAYALDSMARVGRNRIRLVKVDVEGHEGEVLEGMLEVLAEARPAIVVEASGNHRSRGVEALGYRTVHLRGSPNVIYARGEDLRRLEEMGTARPLQDHHR